MANLVITRFTGRRWETSVIPSLGYSPFRPER